MQPCLKIVIMKKIIFLFVVSFVLMFANEARSQAVIDFSKTLTLQIPHPDRDSPKIEIEALSYTTVVSPSGNITKIAHFQLPDGNFLIPKNGMNYIALTHPLTFDDTGKAVDFMVDDNVKINSKGEFRVRFHSNSAGNVFPNWVW